MAIIRSGGVGVGLQTSQLTRTYTSFSGCDIKAVFHNVIIAEIQGVSFSITREKAPIYVMGQPDPVSFSRGKRGVAGSLIFTVFDRHVLHGLINQSFYAGRVTDPRNPIAIHEAGGAISEANLGIRIRRAVYSDQIPPFDLTLTAQNEYGNMATMRIYGVEILNEGSGMSVDDIVNEAQMTFVARHVSPWVPVSFDDFQVTDLTGQVVTGPGQLLTS